MAKERSLAVEKILVIDYGSQYTMLIVRRLRELGVYSEVVSYKSVTKQALKQCKGIILSGGPNSVFEKMHRN